MRRRVLQDAAVCQQVQRRTLARVMSLTEGSRWHGRRGLSPNMTPAQLAAQIGLTTYDDYRPAMEELLAGDDRAFLGAGQRPVMFALSSGTTGRTKHVPVTRSFLADYRRGWQAWGIGTFDTHRKLHTHNIFQIASSHARSQTAAGVDCGNISGLVASMQSPVVRQMYSVPTAVLRVPDPAAKAYAALRAGVADGRVAMAMSANPSTLVQLAEIARDRTEDLVRDLYDGTCSVELPRELEAGLSKRRRRRARVLDAIAHRDGHLTPGAFWPHLSVLACWTGGSCAAYLPRLRSLYRLTGADGQTRPVPIRDHGLSASEGRMTIPLEDETASGLLDTHAHFFEFVPEGEIASDSPTTLLAHELDVGQTYYILLTTSSGLMRYDIHDVVRCTGFVGTTPLLEFLHKGAHIASLTGEKITESQVVRAVRTGCQVCTFTVAPEWGEPPGYVLLAEPPAEPSVETIDRELRRLNEEYDEKRASGRLRPLTFRMLPPGTFAHFARGRQSAEGGSAEQYKHPFLMPRLESIETLQQAAEAAADASLLAASGAASGDLSTPGSTSSAVSAV